MFCVLLLYLSYLYVRKTSSKSCHDISPDDAEDSKTGVQAGGQDKTKPIIIIIGIGF